MKLSLFSRKVSSLCGFAETEKLISQVMFPPKCDLQCAASGFDSRYAHVTMFIEFPASVRSDTYAIDYGRILGADWMNRSANWYK